MTIPLAARLKCAPTFPTLSCPTCCGGGSLPRLVRRLRMLLSDICRRADTGGILDSMLGSRVTSAFMSLRSSSSWFSTAQAQEQTVIAARGEERWYQPTLLQQTAWNSGSLPTPSVIIQILQVASVICPAVFSLSFIFFSFFPSFFPSFLPPKLIH